MKTLIAFAAIACFTPTVEAQYPIIYSGGVVYSSDCSGGGGGGAGSFSAPLSSDCSGGGVGGSFVAPQYVMPQYAPRYVPQYRPVYSQPVYAAPVYQPRYAPRYAAPRAYRSTVNYGPFGLFGGRSVYYGP